MSAELDRMLEPAALAAGSSRLSIESPLEGWPRLAALDPGGGAGRALRLALAWREDDAGAALLEGSIQLGIGATCQRCLEDMELELLAELKLYFGRPESLGTAIAADGFETVELEPGMTLRGLLEDEVLLAMPVFPVHARGEECGALASKLAELEPAEGGEQASGPFAALAALKRKD